MPINSSDYTKPSFGGAVRPDQRADEHFKAMREEVSTKAIQNTADSNKTDNSGKNSNFSHLPKIEPHTIDIVNKKMSQLNVRLRFEMTEDRSKNIVKVMDQTTGDVVRQMPTEEFLKMSERIDAIMDQLSDIKGALFNSEV